MAAEYDLGAAFDAFVLGTSDNKNVRKQPPLQKNVASSIGYRIVKAEDILDERTSKVEQQRQKPIPVQNPLDNQKENLPKAQERAAHIRTRGSGFALADSDVFLQTKAAQDDRDNIAKPDYGTENVPPHQDPPQHAEQQSDCFALTSADDFLKVKARQDTHFMLRGQSHVPLPPPSPRSKVSSPYSALQSKLEAISPPAQNNGRYADVTTAPTKPPKATPEQTLQQRQHSNTFGQTSNANAQAHHKTTAQANPSTRVVSHVRERQVQAEMAARNAPPPAWDAASANNTKSPPQNYKTTRMIQAQKKGRQPGPIDIYQPSPSDSFFLVKRTSQEDYLGVFTIYKRAVDTAADFVRRTARVKAVEIIDTNQVPDFFPANIAYRKTDPDGHSATIFQRAASEIVTVKVMPKPFSSQKVQPGSGGTVYLGLVSSEHGLMVTGICGTHDEAWASCGETCSRIRKSAPFTEYQKARRDSNGMMFVNGQIVNKEYYFFVRPYILDRPVGMD